MPIGVNAPVCDVFLKMEDRNCISVKSRPGELRVIPCN